VAVVIDDAVVVAAVVAVAETGEKEYSFRGK
jgi:hypothetical protein